MATSMYLSRESLQRLTRLAGDRGYLQTRGPGAGSLPSVSRLISALGAGDVVAVGPVVCWRDILSALQKAKECPGMAEVDIKSIDIILRQIERDTK